MGEVYKLCVTDILKHKPQLSSNVLHAHICLCGTPEWLKRVCVFERDETLHQTGDARRDAEMQNTVFISNFPSGFRQPTIMSTHAVDRHTDAEHLLPCLCWDRYKVFISVECCTGLILAWEYCHDGATQVYKIRL